MVPIPGNSWTKRRFAHAAARVRPNHALHVDAPCLSRPLPWLKGRASLRRVGKHER